RTSWSACPRRSGSTRGPRRAQMPLRALLPDPGFEVSLTEGLGEVSDLGLELLLPAGGLGLPSHDARAATLEELALPVPHRLLGDLRSPGGLGDGDLTGQHRQHDPDLLLGRNDRWSCHDDQTPSGQTRKQRVLPPSLTRDTISPRPHASTGTAARSGDSL